MSDKIGPYTLKKLHAATYGADAYTIDGPTDIMGVWKGSEGAVRIGQMNAAYAAGAASKEPERDSAWIIEGCREAWKEGGFEDKDRADERFRTKYQAWACGWHEGRARLIGKDHSTRYGHCSGCEPNGTTHQEGTIEHPSDPDAHLTGDAYLEAKQKRCAVWMKGQSAEEIEREMRGEPSDNHRAFQRALDLQGMAMSALRALEPSKAILLPMGEGEIAQVAMKQWESAIKLGFSVRTARSRQVGAEAALRFANSKAVSIEAIYKGVNEIYANHLGGPKGQMAGVPSRMFANDLRAFLNNLKQ